MLAASQSSAREVVTVSGLMSKEKEIASASNHSPSLQLVRLGARVAPGKIAYETSPNFLVKFDVVDPPASDESLDSGDTVAPLPVEYRGVRPDTLQIGRDVILEGVVENGVFMASSLMTQCPSKYEPPSYSESYSENNPRQVE